MIFNTLKDLLMSTYVGSYVWRNKIVPYTRGLSICRPVEDPCFARLDKFGMYNLPDIQSLGGAIGVSSIWLCLIGLGVKT